MPEQEKDPFAGVKEFMSRIEKVIDLIPANFKNRENLILALKSRLESTKYTAPTALELRTREVAHILDNYLPQGVDPVLEEKIGNIMCATMP